MSQENEEVLDDEDTGVEVEIESTEPEKEEAAAKVQVESENESESGGDDELENYSSKVQNRIKKLTEKYRKEESDREEAVRMAQQLLSENTNLKTRMQNLDKGYLAEYGTRLDTQIAAAKKLYREAYDGGDTEKMLEAQESLSKMSIEQERLRLAKQRSDRTPPPQQEVPQQQMAPQQQPQQPAPKADPKAQGWAEKNDWFGSDNTMTFAAYGIHKQLVDEAFDPTSDDYYDELDHRLKENFPNKTGAPNGSSRRPVHTVASSSRSTTQGRSKSTKVRLTSSQVAVAKKLGVPLDEYAKYVKQ